MEKKKKNLDKLKIDNTHTSRSNSQRRIKTEVHKLKRKLTKLLKLNKQKKCRANCFKAVREAEGKEVKKVSHIRFQGIKKDSERHLNLIKHINTLEKKLN